MRYHISLDINFRKNRYKGTYLALEGVDGCGKTTQAEALEAYFKKRGRTVVRTSEPRVDLVGGDIIMQFFKEELSLPGIAFQYLATANRVVNQDTIVIPALKRGDAVISDRCFWSAVPYGLMDKGVSFPRRRESMDPGSVSGMTVKKEAELMLVAHSLLSQYHQFIVPDTVFYFDISPDVALKRSLAKKKRREHDVYEKKEKIEKVVQGYRWLTKEFKDEFVIVDGEKEVDQVTDNLISHLSDL